MTIKKIITCLIPAIIIGTAECFCQTAPDSKPLCFQLSAAGGFPSRETQINGALHQYNFTVSNQFNEKSLSGYYGPGGYYPSLGLSAGIYHYDRATYPKGTPYSNHYSLSIHYEQTFWSSGRWSSYYLLEEGFGYTDKGFDPVKRPETTFGGHFHVAFHMGAFISYDISDHFRLSAGPSYAHHSNSRTHRVNTGCDAVSAELAITYFYEPVQRQTKKTDVESMGVRKRYWDIQYGACITGGSEGYSRFWTYVSHKVSAAHLWRAFRRFAFGIGADAFFDKGGYENRNAFGTCGAIDCFLTKNLLISGRLGAYLNGKSLNNSLFYETIGLNYTLDQNKWYIPYLGFSTKANLNKAEHLEILIGFRFGRNRA